MINSKLINVLRTFSKTEMKEFEKFAASPYFNKGRNYLPFLHQLVKFYPKFDNEKLTPEFVYSMLNPGKKFNKQIIWNLTSTMMNMAEEYLAISSTRKNKFYRLKAIADEYSDRRLNGYYLKTLSEMSRITDHGGIDKNYFRRKADAENEMVKFHQMEDKQHLLCQNVLEEGKWRILDFLQDFERTICDLSSNTFMYNASYDINIPAEFAKCLDLKKLINYAREKNYEYLWLLEIFYSSIMTVTERSNTEHYFRLKKLYEENRHHFTDYEKNKVLTTLSNYCSLRINDGDDSFRRELFEIGKIELKENLAFPEKSSSKITFIQILRNAVSFNEIKWAKDFVEENIHKLKASHQRSMYSLAYAFIHFRLKDHEKVLENLKKVRFIDVRDKLNVKSLLLRTYFEMRDINSLMYQIDSTRHFLSSNPSISEESRRNFLQFTLFVNRLLTELDKNSKHDLDLFRKEVESEKTLINKNWFYEQIDIIKKGAK